MRKNEPEFFDKESDESDDEDWKEFEPSTGKDKDGNTISFVKDGKYTKNPPYDIYLVAIPGYGLNKKIK